MKCDHQDREENEDGYMVCCECGMVFHGMSYTEEYSQMYGDGVEVKTRNRPRNEKVNPYDEFKIEYSIKEKAYDMYKQISTNSRCSKRKALLAACLYRVYKDHGNIMPPNDIAKIFGIRPNAMNSALIIVNSVIPEKIYNKKELAYMYIDYALQQLKDYKVLPDIEDIKEVINKIFDNNPTNVRPQNATIAAIYYCLTQMGQSIVRKKYATKMNITDALLIAPLKHIHT